MSDNVQTEWYRDTKAKVERWLKDRGFSLGQYGGWNLSGSGWSVNIRPEGVGWSRHYDYSIINIQVNACPKSFTKKILEKSDKTDIVLAKMDTLLKAAIEEATAQKERQSKIDAAKAFQKSVVAEHFPGLDLRYKTEGKDAESFRMSLRLEYLTLDQAKAVTALLTELKGKQMDTELYDVVAINLDDSTVRLIAENKSFRDADAIVERAVMCRGIETEIFSECVHGKYAEGDKWTGQ